MPAVPLTEVLNLLYQIAILALIVLGLAIIFGLLGIMNMAHGDFLMLGAYSMVSVQQAGWPLSVGIPVTIVVCAAAGWIIERLLIRPLAWRPFDTLLATWGLSILIRKMVEAVFGKGYQSIHQEVSGTVDVLGVPYPAWRLVLLAAILVGFLLLALWWRRSPSGARVQAMVANPHLAEALGMDTRRMASMAFILGVVTAGLAGAMLAPLVRIEPNMGLDYLLESFFVLVVGGLGTLSGLFAGSGVIGGVRMLVSGWLDQTWGYLAVLLVSIVFLWLRPYGLVSRR